MPKLSPINAKELIKIFKKQGFEVVHHRGSHVRLRHSDGRRTTIPHHAGEEIGHGLLNKIIKQDLQINREEFLKYL